MWDGPRYNAITTLSQILQSKLILVNLLYTGFVQRLSHISSVYDLLNCARLKTITKDSKCFTRTSLTISEDCWVVTLKYAIHTISNSFIKYFTLLGFVIKNIVIGRLHIMIKIRYSYCVVIVRNECNLFFPNFMFLNGSYSNEHL